MQGVYYLQVEGLEYIHCKLQISRMTAGGVNNNGKWKGLNIDREYMAQIICAHMRMTYRAWMQGAYTLAHCIQIVVAVRYYNQ